RSPNKTSGLERLEAAGECLRPEPSRALLDLAQSKGTALQHAEDHPVPGAAQDVDRALERAAVDVRRFPHFLETIALLVSKGKSLDKRKSACENHFRNGS